MLKCILTVKKQRAGTIDFLTKEEGGRREPLPQPDWCIVITFDEPLKEDEYSALCKVRFLFEHAPHYILDELQEMKVYEGGKIVGKIVFG